MSHNEFKMTQYLSETKRNETKLKRVMLMELFNLALLMVFQLHH